jgi:hypothetical protein
MKMKHIIAALAVQLALVVPTNSYGAWMLWQHWEASSRRADAGENGKWSRDPDSWTLFGAYEQRQQCIGEFTKKDSEHRRLSADLNKDQEKKYQVRVNQGSIQSNGISWKLEDVGSTRPTELKPSEHYLVEITFWCLPAEFDPRKLGHFDELRDR